MIHRRHAGRGDPGPRRLGPTHFAFAIPAEDAEPWKARLGREGVAVEGVVDWPRGARSIYLRDPDGNLAERITPGFWAIY